MKESIDSDIANMEKFLKWTNLMPRGLYMEVMIKHIRGELIQECDYLAEAEA